jgi:hypothetical protein
MNDLDRAVGVGNPAEQHAHLLAASLLNHLTGNTRALTTTLIARSNTSSPDTPTLPTTLPEITRLLDAEEGVHFANLLLTLCPDPTTAERALTDLLTISADQTPVVTKEPPTTR